MERKWALDSSGVVRNFDVFFLGFLGHSGRLERESGVRRRRSEPFGAVLEGFGAVFRVVPVGWSESPVCVGGGRSRLERFGRFWSGISGRRGRLE